MLQVSHFLVFFLAPARCKEDFGSDFKYPMTFLKNTSSILSLNANSIMAMESLIQYFQKLDLKSVKSKSLKELINKIEEIQKYNLLDQDFDAFDRKQRDGIEITNNRSVTDNS